MGVNLFRMMVALMSAAVMQALSSSIINVALPNMTGELGATPDSISWVVTSYMIASAVFMPLTGFLNDRLGRKRFLLISIGGFVVTSGLSGIATSLPEMVVYRLLQGMFGGALIPLSQAIIVETFPREKQGPAIAVWSMCAMLAPILGPTLGGFLTEVFNWRWNFYINLPVGILSLLLAARYVPDTPTKSRDMDWFGFVALATAIVCLQLVLDKGAEQDWFESNWIRTVTGIALVAFAAFLWKSLAGSGHSILDVRVLKDRNLALACVIMLCTGLGTYGTALLLPLYLQTQLGLTAMDAGFFLMPRSLVMAIVMGLVGRYAHLVSTRTILIVGMIFNGLAALAFAGISPQAATNNLWLPNMLQAIGGGCISVPLSTLAFATIAPRLASEAAGIFSLMRAIGMSIGVSVIVTYLNYSAKVHWDGMRGMVNPYDPSIHTFLEHAGKAAHYFLDSAGLHLNKFGLSLMTGLVQQQAMVKAFVSANWLIGASFIAMLPLLLLVKPARAPAAQNPA